MEDSYEYNHILFDRQADPIVTHGSSAVCNGGVFAAHRAALQEAGHFSESPRLLNVFNQRPDPTH